MSEPQQSTAIALGFYGDRLHFGLSVTEGWHPFGPDRLITKSHKNVLYEIDGRPALALYKQYLGEHAAGLPVAGLMFPLELRIGPARTACCARCFPWTRNNKASPLPATCRKDRTRAS
jgi:hypothetical protein